MGGNIPGGNFLGGNFPNELVFFLHKKLYQKQKGKFFSGVHFNVKTFLSICLCSWLKKNKFKYTLIKYSLIF